MRRGIGRRAGFLSSARWRIVVWMCLTTTIGLAGVILAVNRAMSADAAATANNGVVQELEEFRRFSRDGRDPGTAQPFGSMRRLFEVYLSQQRPSDDELLIGHIPRGDDPVIIETSGAAVADLSLEYDILADSERLARILEARSGTMDTPVGEIRWGTQRVSSQNETATFVTVVFMRPSNSAVSGVTRLMLWAALGVLVLVSAISFAVAGQILRPVREMRDAAARISEEDLSTRIPVTSHDEVGDLAEQFNAMLDRLQEAFATGQRFIDDAGHELRTPITVVRGHLELMGDDPAERESTIALVTQELDRMSRIVTDLLSLAKSDRPDFVQPEPGVDVAALTMDIDAKIQALGERRWMLLGIADGTATLDAQRITQAVLQLAQNAVQHTAPNGVISLESQFTTIDGAPGVSFRISDDGAGVHPDDAEVIFERFARGRRAHRDSGAGLGLAIVSAIARAHRGRAFVESVPGEGATFGITVSALDYCDNQPGADDEPGTGDQPVTHRPSTYPPPTKKGTAL